MLPLVKLLGGLLGESFWPNSMIAESMLAEKMMSESDIQAKRNVRVRYPKKVKESKETKPSDIWFDDVDPDLLEPEPSTSMALKVEFQTL